MAKVKLTYHGHSCWEVTSAQGNVIIDPFLNGNSLSVLEPRDIQDLDAIVVTSASADHLGDAVEISLRLDCPIISTTEICAWCAEKSCPTHPLHIGGGSAFEFGNVKLTYAQNGGIGPTGVAMGPVTGVLLTMDEKKIYHAGDTGLFSDMKLIGELWGPLDAALLPIGGNFTMDINDAIHAATILKAKVCFPMHYNTFSLIKANPQNFTEGLISQGIKGVALSPGDTYHL